MIDVLDYGFAWFAVILTLVLAVVYITRKIAHFYLNKNNMAASLNRSLRKPHKIIGVLLIIAGLVHGFASSQTVWSFNYGTICWIISILLGINWIFRVQLKAIGGWLLYHRILTVIFIFSIVWHIIDVGGIRVFDAIANSSPRNAVLAGESTRESKKYSSGDYATSSSGAASSSFAAAPAEQQPQQSSDASSDFQFDGVTLKDGTYTGSADGYGPGLTVSVTVKNGRVQSVEIISHNEKNSRYYAAPIQTIPEEIVLNQSVDVDIVSGATFTSLGIKNAVIDALAGAVISGQLPQPEALPQARRH